MITFGCTKGDKSSNGSKDTQSAKSWQNQVVKAKRVKMKDIQPLDNIAKWNILGLGTHF